MEIARAIRSEDATVPGCIGALREVAESFFAYDAANRMLSAVENGVTTLASFDYDQLGHPAWEQYAGTGAKVSFSWSNEGDLLTLGHALQGTAAVSFTDGYTPAHQIASSSIDNGLYTYTGNDPANRIDPSGLAEIVFGPDADQATISQYSIGVINDAADAANVPSVTITSTTRSENSQASAMFKILNRNGGVDRARRLYRSSRHGVIDAFVAGKKGNESEGQIVKDMVKAIENIKANDPDAFKHTADPSKLQAIDVAPSSIAGDVTKGTQPETGFVDNLRNDSRVSRVLTPPTDPVIHIEIPQPQQNRTHVCTGSHIPQSGSTPCFSF